jgi:hypothetical protein
VIDWPMIDWPALYASRAGRIVSSDVRELARLMGQPDVISFGGGIPEPSLFPREAVAAASQRILGDAATARVALQYSESGGHRPLRLFLAGYMAGQGVPCSIDNILITSGSQQGLDLIARLFLSPGDRALVEMPTYIGALRAFDACEASYGPIGGEAYIPAKFAYAMPDFQNPMGTCLTREERLALLDWAAARGLPLIEDSAYERLRYSGQPVKSLLALDVERAGGIENSRVIYTSTFSKLIVPSGDGSAHQHLQSNVDARTGIDDPGRSDRRHHRSLSPPPRRGGRGVKGLYAAGRFLDRTGGRHVYLGHAAQRRRWRGSDRTGAARGEGRGGRRQVILWDGSGPQHDSARLPPDAGTSGCGGYQAAGRFG